MMDDLIKTVTAKAGISESAAKKAIEVVVTQLKDKLPGGVGEHLDSYIGKGQVSKEKSNNLLNKILGGFKNFMKK